MLTDTIFRETIGSGSSATIMDFIYDNQGLPFALNYSTNNGSSFTTYYYVLNLQGDVVKLVDGGGTSVASYAYDAWGDILSSSGSKAEINPLRYRGYYYDTETGFYYLQSRYYDPVTHRFINADSYSSTGQGIIGYNMFAYCNNSPVIQADHTGEFGLLTLVSAVVSAAVNVATTYIAAKATGQEYTLTDALVSAAIGAVNAIPGAGLLLQVEFRAHTLHIRRLKMELLLVRLRYASQYPLLQPRQALEIWQISGLSLLYALQQLQVQT